LRPFLFALGEPLGFYKDCAKSRFIQDKFIASLDLPTYHDFQDYQFLDILDALSFRLMVLDHINKQNELLYQGQIPNKRLFNNKTLTRVPLSRELRRR
jgi:hypothetical protein